MSDSVDMERIKRMMICKTLGACVAFTSVVSFCTLAARADTTTLYILIQLDKAANSEAALEGVTSISLGNCLVASAKSLSVDQIVATIQCDDLLKDSASKALIDIGRLKDVKQAMVFSVSRP